MTEEGIEICFSDAKKSDAIGIIYFIQPAELVGTKRYKFGCSGKTDLSRCRNYKKGTRYIYIMECKNPFQVEKRIKAKFDEKFVLVAGNEYHEGDEEEMKKEFLDIALNKLEIEDKNNLDQEISDDETISFQKYYEKVCEKVKVVFPDYKNDVIFGGSKKFIKIVYTCDEYIVKYINPYILKHICFYDENNIREDDCIEEYELTKFVADELEYFNMLLDKKIVSINKIYDLNHNKFIDKVIKTKINISVENYDEFMNTHLFTSPIRDTRKIDRKLGDLFHSNMVINNEIYVTLCYKESYKIFKKLKDFENFEIDIGEENYKIISLYKINERYYDYVSFLRRYIPYNIRWDINNNYYILNRNYEFIGLNVEYIKFEEGKGSYRLFDDGCKPWVSKDNYIKLCDQFKKILKENNLNKCLNPYKLDEILTLID